MNTIPFLQSARARLTLWNVLVLAFALLALGCALRVSLARNLMASIDSDLAGRARRHTDFWARNPWATHDTRRWTQRWRQEAEKAAGKGALKETFESHPATDSGVASRWRTPVIERVYDVDGRQSWPPDENNPPWAPAAFARAVAGQEGYSCLRDGNERARVFSAPLRRPFGEVAGVVQIGYSLADMDRSLGNLNRTLLTLIPVALAAAGMGGLFLTGRMLRPVRDITQTAGRIGAEDLSQRLSVRGQDEFSELAATFNAMLARLERSFDQQRRFTADASHELRTPLTVIKANTSLALSRDDLSETHRKSVESVDKAAGLMNRIVQDLLLLARSDAGQLELQLRPTRLSEVLETAVLCVQPQGGAAIQNLAEDSNLMVQGDASHLTRLFVNLLDNAVRHTPASGSVTLFAYQDGPAVLVTVADTGIGIAPEHLPRLCERFYRVDEARSRAQGGTGLGLAICQSIAKAHGGSLDITSSPGVGTTVRITLCA